MPSRRAVRGLCWLAFASVLPFLAACSAGAPPPAEPALTPFATPTATAPPTPFPPSPPATPTAAPATPAAVAASPTPVPAAGPSVVAEYGASGRREVALTFDAGADRGYAEEILDLLAAEGIPASFGIMGQWAEANPDLLRRMVAEGHLLFNHSWSHPSFTGATTGEPPLTTEERLAEVRRTEQVVRDLTGYDLRPYFRPPYGDVDAGVLADLGAAGYAVTLLWSCDSRDSLGATAEEILATCIDTAQPGRIVLLHVGAQSAAYEALPRAIASLHAQGFAFATAEQILAP
jgi:peptidoglycan-N-acetylglucosamine deacetylase